jgi:hypothetical protein
MARVVYHQRSPAKATLAVCKLPFINAKLIHEVVDKTMGTKLRTVGCGSWGSRLSGEFVLLNIDIIKVSFSWLAAVCDTPSKA